MEIRKIGEKTLTFDPKKHKYEVDGQKIKDTVSRISKLVGSADFGVASGWAQSKIKQAILDDFEFFKKEFQTRQEMEDWVKEICSTPSRIARDAANEGTLFHNDLEIFSTKGEDNALPLDEYSETVRRCVIALRFWYKNAVLSTIDSERRIFSLSKNYAGTLDMIARMRDGKIAVIDWKGVTSFKFPVRQAYLAQVSAYGFALLEEGSEVDQGIVVEILRDTGEIRASRFPILANFQPFVDALNMSRHQFEYETF